jgi:hypothetical protein
MSADKNQSKGMKTRRKALLRKNRRIFELHETIGY